ncbi:MAG: tetratricopeptide repeat protein, partial [Candidatus Izemoplasmatales bacterium]
MEYKFKEKSEYEMLLLENKSNSFLYLETLFEYVKYLTLLKDYNLIVSVLEEPLKKDFIQDKDERLKIINKLLQILLKIEDFVKLKNVLDHRNGLITSESDMIMQKFYYAVCYEGLEKYDLAIDTLLSIKDNISNQNLVNKYLKLSMLNLKIDQYLEAKKYFNQAVIFDKSRKNNAFLLAECDLLIYEKNYLKALSLYEDYYIKTNNKYRYLDRYLIIQMALNQLSEGYSFYLKHFPIMNKVLSKQSRLTFYQVALKLMKKLNKNDEIAKLESLIFAINEEFIPFTNISDYSLRLIENNYNKTFAKKRDIIHAIFKEVSQTKMFSKLV